MPLSSGAARLSGPDARAIVEQAMASAGRESAALKEAIADPDRLGWKGRKAQARWLEALATLGRERHGASAQLSPVSGALGLPGAGMDRLLAYLRLHVGEPIGSAELAGVAGISAWQRRLRELRVEHGWLVRKLQGSAYQLDADEPNTQRAERWRTRNRLRNLRGSDGRLVEGGERLLRFFKANVGLVLTKEDLRYVAGTVHSHPRRIRTLIEKGWQIESANVRPGLGPGDYIMIDNKQLPAKARQHIKQRHRLLDEAKHTCHNCGRSPKTDEVRLQVHHAVVPVRAGGGNEDENLVVLCAHCHGGVHATTPDRVKDELLHPGAESLYRVRRRRAPVP